MKNIGIIVLSAVLGLLSVVSCQQFEDISKVGRVETLNANVTLTLDLGDAPVPSSFNVKFINYEERFELNTTMSPQGTVSVSGVIPGIYTISVSSEMSEDIYTYNYRGNAVNVDIIDDNKTINISVGAARSGILVFKEIFYCGSRTPTGGTYFRDQFYEIYNNSPSVQNVRGLAISVISPLTATATPPVWDPKDEGKFVYGLQIWQVPDDQDYPLNPGESIVIAQMADNHQKSNLNPSSPVNLLSAEFETFVRTSAVVLDNPAINMTMAFWPSPAPQWLTTVFGGAFVLYFPSEPIDPNNYTTPVGQTSRVYRIPIDEVMDAVELIGNPNQIQLKRMPTVLDAGAATVNGTYLGVSVARRVRETLEDGRVILYDTNNSSEDFEVMDPPMIRRYGAKAPSWNTWK